MTAKTAIKSLVLSALMGAALTGAACADTTLRFATANPGQNPLSGEMGKWADTVNAALSEAGLAESYSIEIINGTTIAATGTALDRLDQGVIDIGFDLPSYYPNKFDKTSVSGLPGMFEESATGSVALWNLYESGPLKDEYEGYKVLALFLFPNADILTAEPVTEENPISSLKLSATSASRDDLIQALGATPVSIKITEWYQAVQRGVIGGMLQSTSAVPPFSLQEVVHHVIQYPLGGNAAVILMKQDTFDSLPQDVQAVIDKHAGVPFSSQMGKLADSLAGYGRKLVLDNGGDARKATEAEAAVFAEASQKIRDMWVADRPGGQALIDSYIAEVEKAAK